MDHHELNVLQMKVCTASKVSGPECVVLRCLLAGVSGLRGHMSRVNVRSGRCALCVVTVVLVHRARFCHVQLRGFLDSFASLAPAVKEANRAAAVAAAAVGGGAGQAPATATAASGSAGTRAPASAAGPSAAGPSAAADDSDEDDLLVTDEKTADELYEVCPPHARAFGQFLDRHRCA